MSIERSAVDTRHQGPVPSADVSRVSGPEIGLRTAVLTPHVSADHTGGVELFNETLVRALGSAEVFAEAPARRARTSDALRRMGLEQPVGAWRAARALLKRHREEPFDLIVSNGVSGWPLTFARPDIPQVEVYHFTMAGLAEQAIPLRSARLTTGKVEAAFDRLAGVGKHVVAVSQRVLREVESFYGLRGRSIPNAVDTHAFRPTNGVLARQALGLPLGARIGVFVGRPDPTKGYDILLRVARRMPGVLFLVLGCDPWQEGNVRSVGRVPHDDMPRWYAASDFFFTPSRYEGFNLSLLEALSCNLPAVMSQAACPFLEDPPRCGIVVPGDRDEDFVEAIQRVLSSAYHVSPRGHVLERYDFRVFRDSWRGFIESIL